MGAAPFRVALLFHRDLAFCRGVLGGVEAWMAENAAGWHVRHAPSESEVLESLYEWEPDGVLGHVYDPDLAAALTDWGGAFVNTTVTLPDLEVPVVDADHSAVGRMAADHLLERAYRSFGFFGNPWALFSRGRERGFRRRLRQFGYSCSSSYAEYLPGRPARSSWVRIDDQLAAWLQQLAKPAAVFCCHDVPARDLAEACVALGIEVPDEVAILGVDDDRFECELARPTLSSISLPMDLVGYRAAAMLQRRLKGQRVSARPAKVAPSHVVTRQSTDAHAVVDPAVRRALVFLQQTYRRPVSVLEVSRAAGLSRRQLERRFRHALGRTILSEIHRLRLGLACKLLADTELSVEAVAARSGFSGARQMGGVFRRLRGDSPSAFRQGWRHSASGRAEGTTRTASVRLPSGAPRPR